MVTSFSFHSHGAPGGSALPLLAPEGGCLRLGVSVIEERKAQCEAADSFALSEALKHWVRRSGFRRERGRLAGIVNGMRMKR